MALDDASAILLEPDIQRLGLTLHQRLGGKAAVFFQPAYWQGLLMDWALPDLGLKSDWSRLVDALPGLQTSKQIARHACEYLFADKRTFPTGMSLALRATKNPLAASISAFIIRQNVRKMADRFIVGRDVKDAKANLKKIWSRGFGITSISSAKQPSAKQNRKSTHNATMT